MESRRKVIDWKVLTNFNDETRLKVIDFLHTKNMTLNQFAKECGVGQPNLHVFINGKTLAVHNLERIYKYFEKVRFE
jgi:hypothetical protein